MPTEGLLYLQRAFSNYNGPTLPTEDLLYLQKGFLYQEGTLMPLEGFPLPTLKPSIVT